MILQFYSCEPTLLFGFRLTPILVFGDEIGKEKGENKTLLLRNDTKIAAMVFCHHAQAGGPAVHLVGLAVEGEFHKQWNLELMLEHSMIS